MPAPDHAVEFTDREADLATMLVDAMTGEWDPTRYHDTHRQRVEELVAQKRDGNEIVTEVESGPEARVVDLMEALQASVAATGAGARAKAAASGGAPVAGAAKPGAGGNAERRSGRARTRRAPAERASIDEPQRKRGRGTGSGQPAADGEAKSTRRSSAGTKGDPKKAGRLRKVS
jgi:DNA end-binding protein Ku